MKKNESIDVCVLGGGASGMMAALCAARAGAKVLLIEKNKTLGNKLSISGGGRCNITNTNPNKKELVQCYGAMAKFLHSPFALFDSLGTVHFFRELGVPTVTEARHRAFPVSQKATDVTAALKTALKIAGVQLVTGQKILQIVRKSGKIQKIVTRQGEYTARTYVLATGGMSHPETGSTGDGFGFLTELGHTVEKPSPSIVPLAVKESWVKKLFGTSIDNMKISFFVDGIAHIKKTGKVLFTHFGLSGPLILNLSKQVGDLLHAGQVTAAIQLYPDLDEQKLANKILAICDSNKNKLLKNISKEFVPNGLEEVVLQLAGIDGDIKVHSFSKEDRLRLVTIMRALPLTVTGLMGYDRAVIADGGVLLSEIDLKTMQSKLITNLYVTGDLLHINRPSGGFSLQLCWTTGYIAGTSAATGKPVPKYSQD
jgi:predicted Rossmann fold flavoprotein